MTNFFNSDMGKDLLKLESVGSQFIGIGRLSLSYILQVKVPLPSIEKQNESVGAHSACKRIQEELCKFEREILNHPISSKNIEKLVRIESSLVELTSDIETKIWEKVLKDDESDVLEFKSTVFTPLDEPQKQTDENGKIFYLKSGGKKEITTIDQIRAENKASVQHEFKALTGMLNSIKEEGLLLV